MGHNLSNSWPGKLHRDHLTPGNAVDKVIVFLPSHDGKIQWPQIGYTFSDWKREYLIPITFENTKEGYSPESNYESGLVDRYVSPNLVIPYNEKAWNRIEFIRELHGKYIQEIHYRLRNVMEGR